MSKDRNFNPGPWEAVQIEEGLFHIHSPKGDRHNPVPVAVLDHHRDGHEPTRTITTPANAYLIAASPDMYNALQAAEQILRRSQQISTNDSGMFRGVTTSSALIEVQAALKKADGA